MYVPLCTHCTVAVPELRASWPDQLLYRNITFNGMYIVACIYFAICIILAFDVYLPNLQVLEI
jgi:hypothetical protein